MSAARRVNTTFWNTDAAIEKRSGYTAAQLVGQADVGAGLLVSVVRQREDELDQLRRQFRGHGEMDFVQIDDVQEQE